MAAGEYVKMHRGVNCLSVDTMIHISTATVTERRLHGRSRTCQECFTVSDVALVPLNVTPSIV